MNALRWPFRANGVLALLPGLLRWLRGGTGHRAGEAEPDAQEGVGRNPARPGHSRVGRRPGLTIPATVWGLLTPWIGVLQMRVLTESAHWLI